MAERPEKGPASVLFLHPDLGIGGAERLVVDAALALQQQGHEVSFLTAHHDPSHAFEETVDGTLKVVVVGDWLPRSVFGRLAALCAYLRMIYAAIYLLFFLSPDVVFLDLISAPIPIIHLKVKRILFYSHFPDQLLSTKGGRLKALYRLPLDWLEERSTGAADKVLVNSLFTRGVFLDTFKSIEIEPEVLYPSINTAAFDRALEEGALDSLDTKIPQDAFVLLSLNRYERKKKVELAIEALARLKSFLTDEQWREVRLVIAGGYDLRVPENINYFCELKKMVVDLNLIDRVILLKSPTDLEKVGLLKRCNCLVYTPPNEHFGIVPLEAMYLGKPVVAVRSGGPTETVVDGTTGFLCEETPDDFASKISKLVRRERVAVEMGKAGQKRFLEKFSFIAFSNHLNEVVSSLMANM